ncbi:MAG: hypothetical protein RIS70_2093 [Planctomycetota bacterium]
MRSWLFRKLLSLDALMWANRVSSIGWQANGWRLSMIRPGLRATGYRT